MLEGTDLLGMASIGGNAMDCEIVIRHILGDDIEERVIH